MIKTRGKLLDKLQSIFDEYGVLRTFTKLDDAWPRLLSSPSRPGIRCRRPPQRARDSGVGPSLPDTDPVTDACAEPAPGTSPTPRCHIPPHSHGQDE